VIRLRVSDFRIGEEERKAINEVLDSGKLSERGDMVILKAIEARSGIKVEGSIIELTEIYGRSTVSFHS